MPFVCLTECNSALFADCKYYRTYLGGVYSKNEIKKIFYTTTHPKKEIHRTERDGDWYIYP